MREGIGSGHVCLLLGMLAAARPGEGAPPTFVNASIGLPSSTAGYDCQPINPGGWTGVAFADVDGDGDDDLAAVGRLLQGLHVWLSDSSGRWSEASSGLGAYCHGRTDLEFADVNGDGRPDLGSVANVNGSPAVFRNDAPAGWTEVSSGLAAGNGEGFCFGDFDGDGKVDLATIGHFGGGAHAWLGDGAGSWSERSQGLPASTGGHRVVASDFDADGRAELVLTQFLTGVPGEDGVSVWSYDEAAGWTRRWSTPFDQPYGVAAGDVDGDGLPDLLVSAAQDLPGTRGGVHVFLNQGPGQGFVEASAGLPVQDALYGDLAVGDLDGDGDLDVVTGDWGGVLRVFLNDGGSRWTEATGTGLPQGGDKTEGVAVGDLDADCRLDVAIAAYRAGVQVYRQAAPHACPARPEAGAPRTVCAGATVTLDGAASVVCGCAPAEVRYRWWEGGTLLRDWSAAAQASATPRASTTYRLDAACSRDLACFGSDHVRIVVVPAPLPPALSNVLRLAKRLPRDLELRWSDLAGTWGDYQVRSLQASAAQPTPASFDGPPAVTGATAPPGQERVEIRDGLVSPPGLVYFRVRGTAACGGAPGPA